MCTNYRKSKMYSCLFYIYSIIILDVNRVKTTNTQFISQKGDSINSFFPINRLISINPNFDDNVSYDVIAPDIKQNVLASMASSLHGTIVPFDEVAGTDMMMYDDFTNEDLGNVIMDADDANTTQVNEDYDVASFRSIRPQALIRRRNRRKRKRNRNKVGLSQRRPPGLNKYRLRIKNQDNFKTTTYDDFTNPINRPGIQDYKEKRPYLTPGKPHLSKYGQHKTRRRRPENSNSQPNRLLSNLTPQLNNDNSRYAEYEISESTLKENDYHLYNEDEDDEGFLDNFTPYIEEENGVKIPILPAPNPTNHIPPKKYKLIPHRRPVIVTHSPVVGRLSIPKRGYNYNHGTRRGPLTSGPNVHQGRINGQRGERLRAGHPKVNDLINNNNHVRFSETEFRRHKLEEEQRNNANGIRNYKRQHGSRPNIRVHPIDSYRRRQRQKQYRDQQKIAEQNRHQDENPEVSSSIRDDYDAGEFKPSQPIQPQNTDTPSANYHSDHNKNHMQQNTKQDVLDRYNHEHKEEYRLSTPPRRQKFKFDMNRFIDSPKEGEGFFHGKPENFPSLSDLVGEFSEKKEKSAAGRITHMVNYQSNDDGTITAKLQDEDNPTKHYYMIG